MKKIKVILSMILILALFLLNATFAFAQIITNEHIFYMLHTPVVNSYAAKYFSLLINHFGYNVADSCCYVAVAMLLHYYDSFVHTNFVPDNLVTKTTNATDGRPLWYGSPGNMYEKDISGGMTYTQFINDYADTSLHCYLLSLGMSAPLNFHSSSSLIRTGSDTGFGLTADQTRELLMEYLYPTREGVTQYFYLKHLAVRTMFAEDGYTEEAMRTQMINNIDNGIPVIYLGFKQNLTRSIDNLVISGNVGHAMVAYDYNEEDIYVHKGHNFEDADDYDDTIEESGFTTYGGIIWLEVNSSRLPHSCAYNYLSGSSYVCGRCTYYAGTPK